MSFVLSFLLLLHQSDVVFITGQSTHSCGLPETLMFPSGLQKTSEQEELHKQDDNKVKVQKLSRFFTLQFKYLTEMNEGQAELVIVLLSWTLRFGVFCKSIRNVF